VQAARVVALALLDEEARDRRDAAEQHPAAVGPEPVGRLVVPDADVDGRHIHRV